VIHWLLQSLDDCPEILRGDATPAWLSPAERERTFKAEKRRRDWLLGRWTAKNLVQRYLADTTGESPALDAIFIGADADGAPYAARGERRLPISLSISHSHGTAFCGLVEVMGLGDSEIERLEIGDWRLGSDAQSPISNLQSLNRPSLGCDIEFVEPREGNFLDNFFTAAEVAAVREVRERMAHEAHRMNSAPATESALKRTGAADLTGLSRFPMSDADFNRREDGAADPTGLSRFPMADADFNRRGLGEAGALAPADILTTAIWSGKEAVLKAVREGLRIDTRRITCRFDEFAAPPQEWAPFTVIVDEGLAAQFPGVWSGWWRVEGRFALTMALLQETES
jgi:phosphopantetheinyl transferase